MKNENLIRAIGSLDESLIMRAEKHSISVIKTSKRFPIMVAAIVAIILTGTLVVYADEISAFIKSFLNKTGIYATVVDGPAYYLESPIALDNGGELRKVFFTEDGLELILFFPGDKKPGEITVKTDDAARSPDGLSKGSEGWEFGFSHMEPCEKFELTIDGKQYSITLTAGKSVVSGGDIIPAEPNSINWVNLGYQRTENGIQIFTSFTDNELQLKAIGEPSSMEIKEEFTNRDDGNSISNSTSLSLKPLLGYGKDNNIYEYIYDADGMERPLTMFKSDAPAEEEIELKIPGIVIGYDDMLTKFNVEIPMIGDKKVIDKGIDLKLQKIVLQSIERTSATTAELKFALNTGDQNTVFVRDAGILSKDIQGGELLWKDNTCTMSIIFNEELKNVELFVGWPTFLVSGDWTLIVK